MAPKRAIGSRSSRTLLSVTALLLATRLSLETRLRAFALQSPQRRRPATSLQAENRELVAVRDPERIKEQLLDAPNKALVTALERAQELPPQISSMKELEGTWELRGPTVTGADGLASGDMPHAILGLYQSKIGRMLNMEMLGAPRVTIAASGATNTLARLRWGRQRDEVQLQGRLTMISENTLREEIHSTRSMTLKMNMPTLSRPRELKVTYFDGNLIILRDAKGVADVFVRHGRKRQEPSRDNEKAAAGGDAGSAKKPLAVQVGSEADQLLAEVERLKVQLQAERDAASEQRGDRSKLHGEIQKLEKVVAEAAVKAKADSVKLTVMEELKNKVSESTRSQQEKSVEKERARLELAVEVKALEDEVARLEALSSQHVLHEESLRTQIAALEHGLINGPREEWPGFRAAKEVARMELKEVRDEIRSTKNVLGRTRSSLQQKVKQESKALPVVEAELAARKKLEAQLTEQQRELQEQKESLTEKEAAAQALRGELNAAKQQLDLLEAREAEGKERAAQVEKEIDDVVAQAGEAIKAAKGLGTNMRSGRKFWPFR